VDHYSPEGNLLATFGSTSARQLQRELTFYVSRVDHVIYLGVELGKAERALKNNLAYVRPGIARGHLGKRAGCARSGRGAVGVVVGGVR
jgi:hypothetical protein